MRIARHAAGRRIVCHHALLRADPEQAVPVFIQCLNDVVAQAARVAGLRLIEGEILRVGVYFVNLAGKHGEPEEAGAIFIDRVDVIAGNAGRIAGIMRVERKRSRRFFEEDQAVGA